MQFRAKALEQLQQADRLDEAMRVVPPRGWILAGGLALAVAALLGWGVFGHTTEVVEAPGLVSTYSGIIQEESSIAGHVVHVHIDNDDTVRAGDPIVDLVSGGKRRTITATAAGRVIDIPVAVGKTIPVGTDVAVIDPSADSPAALQAVVFISQGEATAVKAGQEVNLVLASAEAAESGFLRGHVAAVGDHLATVSEIAALVGSDEVAAQFVSDEPKVVVNVDLDEDAKSPSKLSWSIGDGPEHPPHAGVVLQAEIITERRSPISQVFGN